jgi:hypothetical protein
MPHHPAVEATPKPGHARVDSAIDGITAEPKEGEAAGKESLVDKLLAIAEVKPVEAGAEAA